MSTRVHQLVFGYEQGHRRLGGSIASLGDSESFLLGATDAPVEGTHEPLLTALPLPGRELFAVAGTWAAPELGRPGAVWSHVLLLTTDQLAKLDTPSCLFSNLRRPTVDRLQLYAQPLLLDLATGGVRRPRPKSRVLADLLASGDHRDDKVVVTRDLAAGEQALCFLWDLCWPALRTNLAFRTRDSIRSSRESRFLTIARRIKGLRPTQSAGAEPPLSAAAWLLSNTSECHDFFASFGPDEPPHFHSFVALADVAELVGKEKASRAARVIEQRFPSPSLARKMKQGLFGPREGSERYWLVPEQQLVEALLAAERMSWDFDDLRLRWRVPHLIREGRAAEITSALHPGGPNELRDLVFDSLVEAARPEAVAAIEQADQAIAIDLLRTRRDLRCAPATWETMRSSRVFEVLDALGDDREAVAAVLKTGHAEVVLNRLPAELLLASGEVGNDPEVLRLVVSSIPDSEVERLAMDQPRLGAAAMAGGWVPHALAEGCNVLEQTRAEQDDVWLRAAVELLSSNSTVNRVGSVLQTVFGPLHHAITDDRLPRDTWIKLDRVLPEAPDPALRLRRLLIEVTRSEGWGPTELERALRDAGPYASELRHEIEEDDILDAVFKAASKAARWFSPW